MALRLDSAGEALKLSSTQTPITWGGLAKLSVDKDTYACLWAWESGDPGSDTSAQLLLTTDATGTDLGVYDGATFNAGVTLTPGTWFRWAVSIGGSPFPMIGYLTTSMSSAVAVVNVGNISPTGLNRFLIGSNSYNAEFWNGCFDDVWAVDAVLTQAQIENMWRSRRKNIVTYGRYPLLHSTKADNLVDMSGNARTLTELGTLSVEDGAPITWATKAKNQISVATAGSGAMSGTSDGVATVTGTLTGSGALSGTSAGTTTAAGTLAGAGAMSGTSAGSSTAAGALTGTSALSGTINGTSTATGTLTGAGAMSGSSAGTVTVAGVLAGAGAISGTASGSTTVTGNLDNLGGNDLVFNGAVLEYQGTPMPRLGRTAWALVTLNVTDRNIFLTDCEDKDYTVIEFGAIWRDERTDGVPYCNAGATLPFTDKLGGGSWTGALTYGNINTDAPDFTTPNTTYWNFVKAIVDECETRGIMVMLFPCYVGFPGTGQGWGPEMVANGSTKIATYAEYVGDLFADNGNIIWMLAGDQGTGGEPFDATELAIQQALHDGIEASNGNSTLFSAEFRRNSTTKDVAGLASRITANMSYANSDNINNYTREAYDEVDYQVAMQEGPFDEEGSDGNSVNTDSTQPCRRYDYWSWLSGIGGYTSGNGYVWPFNDTGSADDWDNHLDTQTAQDEARLNAFIKSTIWWTLQPSGLNGMRNLIPAGQGTLTAQDWIAAAANGDSGTASLLLAYCPPGADGTFNVDLRVMSGTCRLRWFDPTDGTYTLEAEDVANTEASFAVSTPGANNEGTYDDWLLVVDLGGEISGTSAGTSTVSGTLTGTGALSGTSAGAGSATGTAAATGAMSGTAAGAATAVGTLVGAGAMSGTAGGSTFVQGRLRDINAPLGENCYSLTRRPRNFVYVFRINA
jgi:hypothetical protein